MRFVVCLLIGLVVGAILATTAASILKPKQTYAQALMGVIKEASKVARESALDRNCEGIDKPLTLLALTATEIDIAIPHGDPPERVFRQYSEDFSKSIATVTAASGNCVAQREALVQVRNSCEACHRDYR